MNYADARPGTYVRFTHHNGKGRNNPPAPVFQIRERICYRFSDDAPPEPYVDGVERVCVVPYPPYRRGVVMPFEPSDAEKFSPASTPFKAVPAATKRATRRR